ncbi:DUF5336 domain-containing protein [Rhodococcus sp. NPDC127528]|uniref:DUF5336 domain-containing protein n=1 Tax=unclassified Rhodococcus (in: high G+C Gram-positive bacteria) TaxID=192944 RepID=UPI003631DF7D
MDSDQTVVLTPVPTPAPAAVPVSYPVFTDGPPAPERGRATALAAVVLVLGLTGLLVGFGPYLSVHTSAGEVNVSGFVLPQGLLVVVCLLFSAMTAGLSTLPRLGQIRAAGPVLHAISTAAATVGALLALFLLIVVSNVPRLGEDLIGDSRDDLTLVVGLGWAGIAILALAVVQALVAFAALAYDLGLAQTRRAPVRVESA